MVGDPSLSGLRTRSFRTGDDTLESQCKRRRPKCLLTEYGRRISGRRSAFEEEAYPGHAVVPFSSSSFHVFAYGLACLLFICATMKVDGLSLSGEPSSSRAFRTLVAVLEGPRLLPHLEGWGRDCTMRDWEADDI